MLELADKVVAGAAHAGPGPAQAQCIAGCLPDPTQSLSDCIALDLTNEPNRQPRPSSRSTEISVAAALIDHLAALGVERAFGVSGGAIALLFDALQESAVEIGHFRHESGAAFAACEASLASGRPTVVFATTGPGLLNALTGMTAARWDGARVILISGATSAPQRGRWATQETSSYTLPQDAFYSPGSPIFHFASRVEHPAELAQVARRLTQGLQRPGGFVAHVSLPMSVQSQRISPPEEALALRGAAPAPSEDDAAYVARLLQQTPFAIWAGYGATAAADKVRELAERSGAPVFCSPRGKGVMPETHPLYLGVTGLGGHDSVGDYMVRQRPQHLLVLGTRLGEATSFWDRDMIPTRSFLHVDIDPAVPGVAFPDARTVGIQAEIGAFLDALLQHFPRRSSNASKTSLATGERAFDEPTPLPLRGRKPVRPRVLMSALQRKVVQRSDALVLAECGNSFAWCNHYLRFSTPGRYRVSTLFGSMGHVAAGVVGAALATGGKAVAVTGDGSMMMNSEISTAVQYGAQAVWIVLNDAGYGMCRDGHRALGLTDQNVDVPKVDFVRFAESLGARGRRVDTEDQLDEALTEAMKAAGPFLVDVAIDSGETSPLLKRFESLIQQGNSKNTKNVAGWERS
ncbi:MAG: thiamine pyrophosphate-dependent enzyme [Thermoanaerobaculia bacterium]|nr:thiamine pyrophosphate-dependent enzyme [Thermoanaerobaculia bacterium]